jgi:hypothetical protein
MWKWKEVTKIKLDYFDFDSENGDYSVFLDSPILHVDSTGNKEDYRIFRLSEADLFKIECNWIEVNYTKLDDTVEIYDKYYNFSDVPKNIQDEIILVLQEYINNLDCRADWEIVGSYSERKNSYVKR